ncbi:DUF4832 domain-containing protein [candidate division KSB1 bacterium]|nr:DUF4832 domain-containing protein [candidate division KSB1 bacterium]
MKNCIAAVVLAVVSVPDHSYSQSEVIVHPTAIDAPLRNPFKGFAPWIGAFNMHHLSTLQHATFTWRQLEPREAEYDWARLERYWDQLWAMGIRVGFRITVALPGAPNHVDIPQWLVNLGVPLLDYEIAGASGKSPDFDDPIFLEKHLNFIKALGARYDQDRRVAWIDIGSYGFWGEWHLYLNPQLEATQDTKQALLEAYFTAFPTKRKVIAFDDDFATQYVTARGEGVRNDCLGTEESNDWYLESLNRIDSTLNNRAWQLGIITGEFCGSDAGALAGTTTRFQLNYAFVKKTHWSFIGPAGGNLPAQNPQHRADLDLLHKTLGYRYVIRTVRHPAWVKAGDALQLTLEWENVGVAPFYYPWPLRIYLTDTAGVTLARATLRTDIRDLLPGVTMIAENIPIPFSFPPGVYDVRLGIEDRDRGVPGVQLAISGKDDSTRYTLSHVEVQRNPTGVRDAPRNPPSNFSLSVYPNPMQRAVRIEMRFENLPGPENIELAVYDLRGRRVRKLNVGGCWQTEMQVLWDGTDDTGKKVTAGVYIVRLRRSRAYLTQRITRL